MKIIHVLSDQIGIKLKVKNSKMSEIKNLVIKQSTSKEFMGQKWNHKENLKIVWS